ncbi:hypothetical protein LIER_24271 [Lithospermum erythrorhizon]|uniref:Uncharacterized protein n=1 Tax=Lithospermum erythrorhizon TaxID=34254 RepID=A0AAV3R0P6_LITER
MATQGESTLAKGKAIPDQSGTKAQVSKPIPQRRVSTRLTTVVASLEMTRLSIPVTQNPVDENMHDPKSEWVMTTSLICSLEITSRRARQSTDHQTESQSAQLPLETFTSTMLNHKADPSKLPVPVKPFQHLTPYLFCKTAIKEQVLSSLLQIAQNTLNQ